MAGSKITTREYFFCHFCPSVNQPVRPTVGLSACINWVSAGSIFIKVNIWLILETRSRKFKIRYNLTRITVTLHEDQYNSLIIFRSLLLRMANVSDKHCREEQSTYLTLRNILSKIVQFVRKCGKNSVGPLRPQMRIRRMLILCWISKAVNRHSRSSYIISFSVEWIVLLN